MADRQALVLEKAGLVKQTEEIIANYNQQVKDLLGDLPATTQASIDPLNKRIQEINLEIVADVEAENVEACPA
jgi:hypothetical protein|tara:strand:- start:251 stop:469 length:219 start_codon:yes stop_codon:yes gene_type:complete